eukprot:scaffold73142_cov50-Tisochrysis_lutea.AAC.1
MPSADITRHITSIPQGSERAEYRISANISGLLSRLVSRVFTAKTNTKYDKTSKTRGAMCYFDGGWWASRGSGGRAGALSGSFRVPTSSNPKKESMGDCVFCFSPVTHLGGCGGQNR